MGNVRKTISSQFVKQIVSHSELFYTLIFALLILQLNEADGCSLYLILPEQFIFTISH
jgi:hypothetical protein